MERVGLSLLMPYVEDALDPLQFAYLKGRSTDDAACTLIHRLTKHLDAKSSYTARATFIDYSSAFNTIQPHILVPKLNALNVPAYLQLWILDYLIERPQYVRTSTEISSHITLNTGAPQGCVLSPVLFILYTNDLQWNTPNVMIQKYADDTIILGLVHDNNDDEYRLCIDFVNTWCKDNFLNLNIDKTKEIIWDFRRTKSTVTPVEIDNRKVEIVDSYKYLGLIIDDKLTFTKHVQTQMKKVNKRLYCIRSMKKVNVSSDIIAMFYNATVPSVLLYASVAFFGLTSAALKKEMARPYKICKKIIGQVSLINDNDTLAQRHMLGMTQRLINDPTHVLYSEYEKLPSGRRWRVLRARTTRFKNTFVPMSVVKLNENVVR